MFLLSSSSIEGKKTRLCVNKTAELPTFRARRTSPMQPPPEACPVPATLYGVLPGSQRKQMFAGLSLMIREASLGGQTGMPSQKTGRVTAAQSPAGPLSGSGKLTVSGESAGSREQGEPVQHPPCGSKALLDGHLRPSHHPPWSWCGNHPQCTPWE